MSSVLTLAAELANCEVCKGAGYNSIHGSDKLFRCAACSDLREQLETKAKDAMENFATWHWPAAMVFDYDILTMYTALRALGCPFTQRGYLDPLPNVSFEASMREFEENYKATHDRVISIYHKTREANRIGFDSPDEDYTHV